MGIKMKDNKISALLKWTRILFFLNAVVWLGLGILSLSFRALEDGSLVQWVITVLMLINGLVMICFGIMIISGGSLVFTLAILYMSLNVVLSITDQFG
jgi:fatty acid desaturase